VKNRVIYEQPLNEYVRALLRFEYLFKILSYRIKGAASIDSQAVINSTIDILEFINHINFELPSQLAQDIELHVKTLEQWQQQPSVDSEKIILLLSKARAFLAKLMQIDNILQHSLLKNYLLNQIWQRKMIAGGAGQIELPCYQAWLQKSSKERQKELNEWLSPLLLLQEALDFDLYMIRNNAVNTQETAIDGFYKSNLDSTMNFQLVRAIFNSNMQCYPEIIGSKQRLAIKFWTQLDASQSPELITEDIRFELCCCMR